MDQSELRQWESRCTQEEPPRCRAACPLHVDVRAFCTHMAEGDLRKAWGVLCRTLPLWEGLNKVVREYLGHYTVQDLVQQNSGGFDYVI